MKTKAALLFSATILILSAAARGDGFADACSWDAFHPGFHGVGDNPEGYLGAAYDGRYVYFSPSLNDGGWHGEVMRFDATGAFDDVDSWTAFDPSAAGVGDNPKGYWGCVFDGRYVYFVPYRKSGVAHGEVLQLDTTRDFTDVDAWAAFDPGANGVGVRTDGYIGAAFDGRYVYFSPLKDEAGYHGEILRLDTYGDFDDVASWTTYDVCADGLGDKFGYAGAIFDGRFVYFVPNATDESHHGEVRRFDTTGDFDDPTAWAVFDAAENGVGDNPVGYIGAAFDGRYVYFSPNWREPGFHGECLRYDAAGDFDDVASWQAFNPGENGVGDGLEGYYGAVCDGRFVYYIPFINQSGAHANVLRFDNAGDFDDPDYWSTFNPGLAGVSNRLGGYGGGICIDDYVIISPHRWPNPYGQFLQLDTATCPGDVNHDGAVNISDLAVLLANYNMTAGASCEDGDLDHDEDVDLGDLAALLAVYGDACD